jgi:glycine/sarcosine/betaine reductase complex component A
VEQVGTDDLVVLLGTPTAESTRLFSLTLTQGDPTWAGSLAGVRLGLPVLHITDDEVKQQIPPDIYEAQVGTAETVLDIAAIRAALSETRGT